MLIANTLSTSAAFPRPYRRCLPRTLAGGLHGNTPAKDGTKTPALALASILVCAADVHHCIPACPERGSLKLFDGVVLGHPITIVDGYLARKTFNWANELVRTFR